MMTTSWTTITRKKVNEPTQELSVLVVDGGHLISWDYKMNNLRAFQIIQTCFSLIFVLKCSFRILSIELFPELRLKLYYRHSNWVFVVLHLSVVDYWYSIEDCSLSVAYQLKLVWKRRTSPSTRSLLFYETYAKLWIVRVMSLFELITRLISWIRAMSVGIADAPWNMESGRSFFDTLKWMITWACPLICCWLEVKASRSTRPNSSAIFRSIAPKESRIWSWPSKIVRNSRSYSLSY